MRERPYRLLLRLATPHPAPSSLETGRPPESSQGSRTSQGVLTGGIHLAFQAASPEVVDRFPCGGSCRQWQLSRPREALRSVGKDYILTGCLFLCG